MALPQGGGRKPLGAARPLIFPLFSNTPHTTLYIKRKHPHYSPISYRRVKRVEYLDKSPFDRL